MTNLLILILQQKQNLHPELKQFMAVKRVMACEELKLEKHLQKCRTEECCELLEFQYGESAAGMEDSEILGD